MCVNVCSLNLDSCLDALYLPEYSLRNSSSCFEPERDAGGNLDVTSRLGNIQWPKCLITKSVSSSHQSHLDTRYFLELLIGVYDDLLCCQSVWAIK